MFIKKNLAQWLNNNRNIFKSHKPDYQTRFDDLSRAPSAFIFTLIICILIYSGFFTQIDNAPTGSQKNGKIEHFVDELSDLELYKTVIASLSKSGNYYASVVELQRKNDFPVKPFITIRAPFLALIFAKCGFYFTEALHIALILAVSLASWDKLKNILQERALIYTVIIVACSCFLTMAGSYFHDSWAGLLIALSLLMRTPEKYKNSVLIGLAATLLRELAICYLFLMAVFAIFEKNKRESLYWLGAIGIELCFLVFHYFQIQSYVLPNDPVSQGWNELGGWSYYLHTIYKLTILGILPVQLAYAIVPLCFFGWLTLKSNFSLRIFGLISGYAVMVMLFARHENFYWSFLATPLLLAGLVLSTIGIKKLILNIT